MKNHFGTQQHQSLSLSLFLIIFALQITCLFYTTSVELCTSLRYRRVYYKIFVTSITENLQQTICFSTTGF